MNNKTHPLALKKTEVIWEGKYDTEGRRVAALRMALPYLDLFESPANRI
ncbi:MAG: hypothetical protein M3410_18230 [Acidobacteriota bacterium]|nr:hypothetical protein [Acidobacteriota bacterium]